MPFDAKHISQDEVLLQWYRSEATVDWQREHREELERGRQGRSEIEVANEGVRYLRGALLQCRSSREAFFDAHATSWFEAKISLEELAKAAAIDSWGLRDCHTVLEASGRRQFLRGAMVSSNCWESPLIVVSQTPEAATALVLLDGYRRSAVLLHERTLDEISVHWGVCAGLTDWDYFRSPPAASAASS